MKFKEKASSLALCAVLLGTSIAPVSAATKTEIVGANRYETAAKIADKMGNYDTAILVNADKSLADGLSASSLAGKENAPILLVKKDSIPAATMQRLRNVKRVYVIGGTAAIGSGVTNKLSGKDVTRIEGKNRIETSENVAKVVGNYDEAFIVNGNKGEADAMSVASVAARDKAPIILTNGTSSNQSKKSGVKYYVVGGSAVVSNSLVNKFGAIRLSGSNRYATNRAVVSKFYANSGKLYYTKGDLLVDALTVSSLAFGAIRLSGSNRYATNRAVVSKFYANSGKLYYTKGDLLVDALTVSSLAKNNGVVLVSAKSDNSILKDKEVVQVGGMNFNVNFDGSAKPEENKPVKPDEQKPEENKPVKPDGQKPEENKPVKPDGQKPNPDENKPVKPDGNKPDGGTQKPEEQKPPVKNTKPKFSFSTLAIMVDQNQPINFSEYGIKAYDAEDGDLTAKIKYDRIPDTSIPGSHSFKATVTDKGGLTATLNLSVYVKEYDPEYDAKIKYDRIPDTSIPGSHSFKATVTDKGGLTATLNLSVYVKEYDPEYDTNSSEYLRRARAEFNRLLSQYRSVNNCKAVVEDSASNKLSQLKSEHMAKYNYFDHDYNGKGIHDIYPEVGAGKLVHQFENIYTNKGLVHTPEELAKSAFTSWVNSGGHRAALLYNGDADCYGFGVYKASNGKVYATYHIDSYK